jgi:hypothetical protein
MKESHGEGLASHTDPESCAASRKAGREALTPAVPFAPTTDFWITQHVAIARFQGFGVGFEFWQATFSASASPPITFEFVIFCDDFGGIDSVPRIWNTNGGNRFRASV